MAISIDWMDPTTGSTTNLYGVIDTLAFDKTRKTARIDLRFYRSRRARQDFRAIVTDRIITVSADKFTAFFEGALITDGAESIYKLCYRYVRTLPEFQNATDVLEALQSPI